MEIGPTPEGKHPWGDADSPYVGLGGDDGVKALAWAFYDVVEETSANIRAMLPANTEVSRQKLYEFLSGWTGGPPLYWERRGHPALRMRHASFPIDQQGVDEWTRCLQAAVERRAIDAELGKFLIRELGSAARHLRNRD